MEGLKICRWSGVNARHGTKIEESGKDVHLAGILGGKRSCEEDSGEAGCSGMESNEVRLL